MSWLPVGRTPRVGATPPPSMKAKALPRTVFVVCLALFFGSGMVVSCSDEAATPQEPATYVGRATCQTCHSTQHDAWHGSHHDLAMQPATEENMLGNFDDATFERHGVTSKFFRKDGKFMVRTDGADGKLADFEIAYAFGVYPLQQYLVKFPRGRVQTLGICWDSRPKEKGGQRWYHLYEEKIAHDDPLHWTGRHQNWNYMCANCHSTNLRKNYDIATDTYKTTWSEIDVSCEACHGPASHHVTWAQAETKPDYAHKGFAGPIVNDAVWTFKKGAVTAERQGGAHAMLQTELCARCHSRRSTMREGHVHGPLLDAERLTLLDPILYHPDGQINEEVYVYGSFVQSKMHHKGVTCTDCHDPHTLKPHAPGNALCVRCHQSSTFDTEKHHHHKAGSTGASCVACHMPTKHYMVVDPRLDHSIRIPRPDLTVKLGTPNACNQCHGKETPQWASTQIAKWYGPNHVPKPHFAEALHAGRTHSKDAAPRLAELARDPAQPGIARATAFALLQEYPGPAILPTIHAGLKDPDPVVRFGALGSLEGVPANLRFEPAAPLVKDPVLAVRAEAARILAPVPRSEWTPEQRPAFEMALREYEEFQMLNGDQPWAHTNLGIVQFQQGEFDKAATSYRRAIRLDNRWVQAYVNLGDLHRDRRRDDLSEKVLREGLTHVVDSAELHHALGLALARNKKIPTALVALEQAANLRPDMPMYSYAYGVALHSTGKFDAAVFVLENAHRRTPTDFDLVFALTTFHRDRQQFAKALHWASKLVELAPRNEDAHALLRDLRRRR